MLAYIFASRYLHIMETRRDVFQAIADPTRRQIINMVASTPQNLNSISDNFEMSRQAISLHIKILIECGIIEVQQKGRERLCSVQPKKLAEVADFIEPFRKMWEQQFDRLDLLLKNMDKQDKPTKK
jgi:DNA-binding transcriptional ArsR family regulator